LHPLRELVVGLVRTFGRSRRQRDFHLSHFGNTDVPLRDK
jgi:hypothetical protein